MAFCSKKCNRDYEYYLKDHLGNTRVVFTTDPKTHTFTLDYEGLGNDDEALFEDVSTISNDIFDHTDQAGTTYTHAQMLNGTEGSRVGSVLAIPVGMGDTLNAKVYAKYVEVTTDPTNAVTSLANSLIGAFTGGIGGTNELGNQSINNNFGSGSLLGTTGFPVDGAAPMAFLNVMFLPEGETITLDGTSFAYDQISGTATQPVGQPKNTNYDELSVTDFIAPSQGYLLVYLSNESSTIAEVYFDDLEIVVNEHPVIQTDDYYPFGGQFNSYQRITAKQNDFLYTKQEKQDELGIALYDYNARFYDPMIGRFINIDPLADIQESYNPYHYVYNNPISFTDPSGMIAEYGEQGLTSTFVNPDGGIIEHRDDGDPNIYLVDDVDDWFDGGRKKDDLPVVGQENPNYNYQAGQYINLNNKAHNLWGFDNPAIEPDYTLESFAIPLFSWLKYLKWGKLLGKTGKYAFKVTQKEGNLLFYSVKIGDEVIEFGGNFTKSGSKLIIKNFDVDGNLTNKLGLKGIKALVEAFGRQQGVKKVVIEGAKRTTGAKPGKFTNLTFDIN